MFHGLYLTLLLGSLYFSKDTVTQFFEAKTSFHTIISDIESADLPVIIVCYKRAWDLSMKINTHGSIGDSSSFSVTNLILDKVATKNGPLRSKECKKIAPRKALQFKFLTNHFYGTSYLSVDLESPNASSLSSDELDTFIASEDNSYGISLFEFFDGHVPKLSFQAGIRINVKITGIIQHNYIKKCMKASYYETLAKWYTSENLLQLNLSYPTKSNQKSGEAQRKPCDFTNLCLPIHLPSNITICNRTTDVQSLIVQHCYGNGIKKIQNMMHMDIIQNNIFKSCKNIEYEVDAASGVKKAIDKSKIALRFKLQVSRSQSRVWQRIPKKTILEEYFIMDEISFVGLIGGTLGLFVGLSFLDLASQAIEVASFIREIMQAI